MLQVQIHSQGRFLNTPEGVPFRLTRDLMDGCGAAGGWVPHKHVEQTVFIYMLMSRRRPFEYLMCPSARPAPSTEHWMGSTKRRTVTCAQRAAAIQLPAHVGSSLGRAKPPGSHLRPTPSHSHDKSLLPADVPVVWSHSSRTSQAWVAPCRAAARPCCVCCGATARRCCRWG